LKKGEEEELLALNGSKLYGQYEILTSTLDSISIDRFHYSNSYLLYFVVGFWPEGENNFGIEILNFKKVTGCCRKADTKYDLDFYEAWNTRKFSLIQDVKTRSILKNDSIYLSIDGLNYWTLPMEGRISGWSYPADGLIEYVEKGVPVNLMRGGIRLKKKDRKGQVKFQLGFISYEYGQNYDWDAFLDSQEFKNFVMFGGFLPNRPLSLNDYISN